MFRILPLLIIIMAITIFTKSSDVVYNWMAVFHVAESKAANEAEQTSKNSLADDMKGSGSVKSREIAQKKERQENALDQQEEKKNTIPTDKKESTITTVNVDGQLSDETPKFTQEEVEILQSLSKRRDELDLREKDVTLKENSLLAIEKNIDNKIEEMQQIEAQLKVILTEYNKKEDEKIRGLIKVYENMKPADAAKIFDQLQTTILIEVAAGMKEAVLAQILSKMDAYKAKELTVELANRRSIKAAAE